MKKKLLMLTLALGSAVAASLAVPQAEAACKQICCWTETGPACVTCCQAPCPTIVCPP